MMTLAKLKIVHQLCKNFENITAHKHPYQSFDLIKYLP